MKYSVLLLLVLTSLFFVNGCGKSDSKVEITAQEATESVKTQAQHESKEKADEEDAKEAYEEVVEEKKADEPEQAVEGKKEETQVDLTKDFYSEEISDAVFARMAGKSFKSDCTVPREDLRYLHVLYVDFNGDTQAGELVVNQYIAQDVLEIFQELYLAAYPIEKIRLVDDYDAVDEASMADNNSSAFNFRFISYTTKVSKHGLGLAIDINPLYNPYVKTVNGQLSIEPANGAPYVDRSQAFNYKIDTEDLAYKTFKAHGFSWGGNWKSSKDYQHFEVTDAVVKQLYPEN